jgi:hypothetical protein
VSDTINGIVVRHPILVHRASPSDYVPHPQVRSSASPQIRALDPGELIARQPGLTEHARDEAVFPRTALEILSREVMAPNRIDFQIAFCSGVRLAEALGWVFGTEFATGCSRRHDGEVG